MRARWPAWPRAAADAILSVLVAPACAACGVALERPLDGPVCPACWAAVRPITPPICDVCGDPLPSWRVLSQARAVCARCRRAPRAVDRSRAVGVYDGTLRAIIHAFKYDGRRGLAAPLAARMAASGAALLAGADCVVPVPLHRRRRRARGYNQAGDLAARLPLPLVAALARTRATAPQAGLPAARRHANVRDAFSVRRGWPWRPPAAVRGRVVVLVDDVATTGATLEACARVLKAAGAREVRALTAARVVLGPPTPRLPRPRPEGARRR